MNNLPLLSITLTFAYSSTGNKIQRVGEFIFGAKTAITILLILYEVFTYLERVFFNHRSTYAYTKVNANLQVGTT